MPMLVISQGNWNEGPTNANTLSGSVAYIANANLTSLNGTNKSNFIHECKTGDSGTQQFIFLNNNIFLYRLVVYSNGYGEYPGLYSGTINDYIKQADTRQGINTGLSATFVNPINYL
jgi:hypothetical protein